MSELVSSIMRREIEQEFTAETKQTKRSNLSAWQKDLPPVLALH
jgi:hypothetical protein